MSENVLFSVILGAIIGYGSSILQVVIGAAILYGVGIVFGGDVSNIVPAAFKIWLVLGTVETAVVAFYIWVIS